MNRRALVVALALASMGAALLFFYLHRFEQEASGGEKVRLLATVKPLERGTQITEDAVAVREIPQAYVEDRAIKAIDKTKIVGMRLGNSLGAQETMLWSDLAVASEERRDLSSLIQPNSRAVAVRAANDDKSVALIHPGDYVDVIVTVQNSEKGAESRKAMVILQRVLILAVGLDTESRTVTGPGGQPANARDLILTVSVGLEQGQLLALAAERGRLSVAVRNGSDPRVYESVPDVKDDIFGSPIKVNSIGTVKRPTALVGRGQQL